MKRYMILAVIMVTVAGCAPYSRATRLPARQTIDIYNPDSTRKAYGVIGQDGYFELFSPSGERLGYGRAKVR